MKRLDKVLSGSTDTYSYYYRAEGWLAQVSLNGTTIETYGYDANGNRTSASNAQMTVDAAHTSYDHDDRLLTYGNYTCTYTDNGELSTKTDALTPLLTRC